MKKLNFYYLFFALLFFMASGYTKAQTITLMPTDDATVFESMPETTGGSYHNSNLFVGEATDSTVMSFVKFDFSQYSGRLIESAGFSTRSDMQDGKTMTVKLTKAGTGFTRDTTDWNNKPSSSGELATVVYDENSNRKTFSEVGTSLIDYINGKLMSGVTEIAFGLAYKEGDGDQFKWMGGKGDGSYGPMLEITFTPGYSAYAIDDASVFEAMPETTAADYHGSNIFVGKGTDSTVIAYVKFDISKISGQIVNKVEFSTRSDMQDGTTMTVKLTEAGTDFTRDTTDWNNKPSTSGELATTVYDENSNRKIFTPAGSSLTDYVNSQLLLGKKELAFAIKYKSGDGDQFKWAAGKGDGSWGPVLEMEFGPGNPVLSMMPTADATVYEAQPDKTVNNFHGSNIFVGEATDSTVIAYVKFSIAGLQGKVVENADFSTRSDMQDGQTMTTKLTKAGTSFNRDTTTWNNKPSTSGELATVVLDQESNRKTYVPVGSALVDYINSKILDGKQEVAFGIEYKEGAGDQFKWMGGKGEGSWGPMLELTFARKYNTYAMNDATVFEANPETTGADFHNSNLFVGKATDSTVMSFVKFELKNINGQKVSLAKFSTRSDMQDGTTMTVKLTEAGNAFTRDTTNWGNKPSTSGELATVVLDQESNRKVYNPVGSNLVDYINKTIAIGNNEIAFGIAYKSGDGDQLKWMAGKGDGSWGPMLELEFESFAQNDTLTVIADAYVDEENPDQNNNNSSDMQLRKAESLSKNVLIKFDISEVANTVAGKAELALYIDQKETKIDEFYVSIFGVDDQSWSEGSVTWNNQPTAGDKLIEAYVPETRGAAKDTVWSSDAFTHYVNEAILAGQDSISFVLKGTNNTDNRCWMAEMNYKLTTKLMLNYEVNPPLQDAPVVADSYISQADPDANYGGEADMHLINDETNNASKWVFLKYDISGAYGEVVSSTLNVYGAIHSSAPNLNSLQFGVYGADDVSWSENTVSWNNKPSVSNNLLAENVLTASGKYFNLGSEDLTEYVNEAIINGDDSITFVIKALEETPGERAWISGMNYRASSLSLNYEPIAKAPMFSPEGGTFIAQAEIELSSLTANSTVYYTLGGETPDNTSTEYTGPIVVKDTTIISAITYAPDLKPSPVVTEVYNVPPVGMPEFIPSPQVKYPDSVTIRITAAPDSAVIYYSDDGSDPTTIYTSPIHLEDDATIKVQVWNESFTYSTEIVEAIYDIIPTNLDPGVGPGGVGYKELGRTNQPLVSMWLKPEALSGIADGEDVTEWADMSGNENDAYNTYVEGGNNKIVNTGESQKAPPVFVDNALNGWPALQFGSQEGEKGSLIVDDADNLDGSNGHAIFTVMKRNEMIADFAAVIQKRDITAEGDAQEAYVLEMNGGSNPHKMQYVLARDHFLRNNDTELNDQDYYVVNPTYNGQLGLTSFKLDGYKEGEGSYSKLLNNSHSPVIIGGFQAMNLAEVITFNSPINEAQNVIVNNYLAGKYGLDLVDGDGNVVSMYTNTNYISDIIGVGKTIKMTGSGESEHNYSAGGGLEIQGLNLPVGSFVFAGHNGTSVSSATSWERKWNIETTGDAADVKLYFDFNAVGLTPPSAATGYVLSYDDGSGAVDMDVEPSLNDGKIVFTVNAIANGVYSLAQAGVVATPSFDPAGGDYAETQTVTISTSTKGATIYYTTDGSDPDNTSTEYTDPITVDSDMTIKAIAYKDGMTTSAIAEATYSISTGIYDPALANGMKLYPNPAGDVVKLVIENSLSGMFNVRIYDLTGRVVNFEKLAKTSATLEKELIVKNLEPGIYFVEIQQNQYKAMQRMIKK